MRRFRHALAAAILLLGVSLGVSAGDSQASGFDQRPAESAPLLASATTISSDITQDTTWTAANSPYLVTQPISVASGVTLTVDPGVTVQFAGGTGLTVDGTLKAVGTSGGSVSFLPATTDPQQQPGWWNGLRVVGTDSVPNVGSVLTYVTIAGVGPAVAVPPTSS